MEPTTQTTEKTFEPIVVSFDEHGFNAKIREFEDVTQSLNGIVQELKEEFEITFTDREIFKYFIKREDPKDYINRLYKDLPKLLRDMTHKEVKAAFREVYTDGYLYSYINNHEKYYTVSKGEITLDKETIDKELKPTFEQRIETERAKRAYDLHDEIFNRVNELVEMGKENKMYFGIVNLFMYDQEHDLKKAEINYNII